MNDGWWSAVDALLWLLVGVALLWMAFDRRRPAGPTLVESRLRSQVIVTLRSGEAFQGVLWAHDDRVLILREAQLLGAGENRAPLGVDGELVIPGDQVAYVQITRPRGEV